MYVRSRYLCLVAAASDAALVFGAPPLQYLSWSTARANPSMNTVLLLLAANIALFMFLTCGMVCSMILARRGIRLAFRRVSRSFVRPSRALRS
ncbi:MAG TPA: hypothetical protein VFE17_03745 [Candidatus Baltobacteraceae bacterium]|jgi:hypothetical protein|nr:hypothetical protein [Candidatus Baltobacteraceae bacterium]